MKMLFRKLFLTLVLFGGLVAAWPKGRPDCRIDGEWKSDKRTLSLTPGDGVTAKYRVKYSIPKRKLKFKGRMARAYKPKMGTMWMHNVDDDEDKFMMMVACYDNVLWVSEQPSWPSKDSVSIKKTTELQLKRVGDEPDDEDLLSSYRKEMKKKRKKEKRKRKKKKKKD